MIHCNLKCLVIKFHDLARKIEALENNDSAYITLEIRRNADLLHNIEKCLPKNFHSYLIN
jgi:hypothetical protein